MLNKDEIKGKAEQAKGAVKEKVGEWTGDPALETEGEIDQTTGKVRETVGTARRKTEEAVDEVKKNLDR